MQDQNTAPQSPAGGFPPPLGTTPQPPQTTPPALTEAEKPSFMTVEQNSPETTNQTQSPDNNLSLPDTSQQQAPPSFIVTPTGGSGFGKKAVAGVLGLVVVLGGLGAGIILVRNRQTLESQAWDCPNYKFVVTKDGTVTVNTFGTTHFIAAAQKANVLINGQSVQIFDVPKMNKDTETTLGTVTVPSGGIFTWRVVGTQDCESEGEYKTETVSQCANIKTFDEDWNELSSSDLSALKAGDKVRFSVLGTTTAGSFDKARFTINGTLRPETNQKRPATDEYFEEYEIPANTTSFTVTAQLHNAVSDTWH